MESRVGMVLAWNSPVAKVGTVLAKVPMLAWKLQGVRMAKGT